MKRKIIFMLSLLLVFESCSTNSSKSSSDSPNNPTAELAFNTLKAINNTSVQGLNKYFITFDEIKDLGIKPVSESERAEYLNQLEVTYKGILESGKDNGIDWANIVFCDMVDYKVASMLDESKVEAYEGKLQFKYNDILYSINVVSINTGNGIKLLDLSGLHSVKKLYEGAEKAQNENDMIKSLPFDVKISGNLGKYYEVFSDTIVLSKQEYSENKEFVLVVHLKRKDVTFDFNPEACTYVGNAVSLNKECDNCEYNEFYLRANILDADGLEIINAGATKGVEDLLTRGGGFGNIKKILFPLSVYDTQKDAEDIIKKVSHVYLEGAHN